MGVSVWMHPNEPPPGPLGSPAIMIAITSVLTLILPAVAGMNDEGEGEGEDEGEGEGERQGRIPRDQSTCAQAGGHSAGQTSQHAHRGGA